MTINVDAKFDVGDEVWYVGDLYEELDKTAVYTVSAEENGWVQLREIFIPTEDLPWEAAQFVPATKPVDFELDFGLLRNAAGAPGPWASEMARLVRTVAGVEFAAESFEPLLTAFSRQAAAAAKRSLALEVANQPVMNAGSADTLSGALQFRNMLSERLLMESA